MHVLESKRCAPHVLAALIGVVGGLAACAGADEGLVEEQPLAQQAGKKSLQSPTGGWFADVTASGTGCPAGSANTSISEDGQVFTTTFSAYELMLTPELPNITKNCALTMKLRSNSELSFAVVSVYYSGFALLEPGVSGRQMVKYGFHGNSSDAGNSRKDFTGPLDQEFVIQDDVGVTRQRWSPCGTEHTLTASTEVRLTNGTPRASGYINMAAVDGSIRLDLRVAWRTCAKPTKDAGPPGQPGNPRGPARDA